MYAQSVKKAERPRVDMTWEQNWKWVLILSLENEQSLEMWKLIFTAAVKYSLKWKSLEFY
jgi:hypothetical protein